jgi:hypothetical protein
MKTIITEGLDWHDLENILEPTVEVDTYAAHMGTDANIITLAFIIKSEQAGNDLVDWFEKGYEWVLDASVSEGELSPGKYLVFVELSRRSAAPERIIELIEDLKTLTGVGINDWTVIVDDDDYPAELDVLQKVIITSPHQYRVEKEKEEELNEMRKVAGLEVKRLHTEDAEIRAFKSMAGL